LFLLLYAAGFQLLYGQFTAHTAGKALGAAVNTLTTVGLYAVNFLVVMVSVLTSVDTISGEIASHTIHSIVSKPLRRWEVMLGKWLGFALMISGYVLLMAGGVAGIAWAISGTLVHNLPQALATFILEGLVLLSLTLLGGTRLSTMANGVMVFTLFGLAFLGGWTEQIGSLLGNESAVKIGIISSLILPTEALWRRIAHLVQPPRLTSFGMTPFSPFSVPSTAMVIYAILYALAALAVAIRSFEQRDL
ncbi:MAG: ABC transporter permease, partial [Anaerolineae bacterium]